MEYEWYNPSPITEERLKQEQIDELEIRAEYALRNLVTPPIKGAITKGKLRWRGIRSNIEVFYGGLLHRAYISGCCKIVGCHTVGRPVVSDKDKLKVKIMLIQRNLLIDLNFSKEIMMDYEKWKHSKNKNYEQTAITM